MEPTLPSNAKAAVEAVAKSERFREFTLEVSMGCSAGDNFLGEIYRVVVEGKKESGEDSTLRLIVKMSPSNELARGQMRFDLIYAREIMMYTTILPKLDELQASLSDDDKFRSVKSFYGKDEILIMEDLSESGYKMCDRLQPLSEEHLFMCINNIARLHAASFALKIRDPDLYAKITENSAQASDFGPYSDGFIEMYKDGIKEVVEGEPYEQKINELITNWGDEFAKFYDSTLSLPFDVLCHGDCWSNNYLFKYENGEAIDMRFLDWQMIRKSSPCFDLGYFIFTTTDKETRLKHYDNLLTQYYEILTQNLSKMGLEVTECYPESIYWEHLKIYMRYGVLQALMILPMILKDRKCDDEVGEDSNESYNIKFSKTCIHRLKEIFEDATESGLI